MAIGIGNNYGPGVSQAQPAQKANSTKPSVNATPLDDFKREMYEAIGKMTHHASQAKTQISISISDKAFEKMRTDPAYKDLMLRTIQRDLNGAYPAAAAPSYSVITIGDDGEYKADAMGSSYGALFSTKSAGSFWEKNTKKSSASYEERKRLEARRYQDVLEKKLEEKRLEDKRRLDEKL
jgi:hypothetical protein